MDDVEKPEHVVVVGTGLAGGAAARELRAAGFQARVTLIGSEARPPYERPPLSKEYLRAEASVEDAYVEPAAYWAEHRVDLVAGRTVTGIDLAQGLVVLDDGESVRFDRLLLATGAAPRTPSVPGGDLDGVVTLRTIEDADAIRSRALAARRVLVVGGGWIGTEVSASLRSLGCEVTMALAALLPLQPTLGPEVAGVYARMHAENEVELRPGTRIVAFDGGDTVRRARAESGEWLECDLAVIAIGVRPRVDLALEAGLHVTDGIVVDGSLATSDPRVFAAGDVARAPIPLLHRPLRVEHWSTALAHGVHAARAMLGPGRPYDAIPYFFSDQYDTGMEFWGDPALPGELVARGDLATRSFTAFWQEQGHVRAALNMHVHQAEHSQADSGDAGAVSADVDVHQAAAGHVDGDVVERLLRRAQPVDVRALQDPAVPLDELVETAQRAAGG